jgi:hypothetical protein
MTIAAPPDSPSLLELVNASALATDNINITNANNKQYIALQKVELIPLLETGTLLFFQSNQINDKSMNKK